MHFISILSSYFGTFGLFGLILLLGLIGGYIASRFRYIPIICGYLAAGFLIGPHALDLVDNTIMNNMNFFVDISFGLIMFNLGRYLDFRWLRHDNGLLFMAIAESIFTFILIFILLILFKVSWQNSLLMATIAIATSPAIVMMIANDLSSEGPVTRRTLVLTSLNNLFALTLFSFFIPLTQPLLLSKSVLLEHVIYKLFGSFLLGMISFVVMRFIAKFIGKQIENQFVLLVGSVILAISLSRSLQLSTILTLFTMGVAARNIDQNRYLLEVEFGWIARLFFILLFVSTGMNLDLTGLWQAPILVILFLLIRALGKWIGISLFSKTCQLTFKQTFAISAALTPLSNAAISMSYTLTTLNPALNYQYHFIIMSALTILDSIGPFATQFAFLKTGEGHVDPAIFQRK